MPAFKRIACTAAVVGSLIAAPAGFAQSVTLNDPGNSGIQSINFNIVGSVLTIEEVWRDNRPGYLQFTGCGDGVWTINKVITNNSGSAWNSFANELLDPFAQGGNDALDPLPYPAFVPPGFSTSNDSDGLSFAQGSGLPRASSVFASVVADELTDARDFLDFFNGLLANGQADNFMTFGLIVGIANEGSLLVQRPNEFSTVIPVPAALPLLLSGLIAMGVPGRRRKA